MGSSVPPLGGTRREDEVRHLFRIEEFMDRGFGGRTEGAKQQKHVFFLNEFACLFDRPGRVVTARTRVILSLTPDRR